jgi:hypothetical protein
VFVRFPIFTPEVLGADAAAPPPVSLDNLSLLQFGEVGIIISLLC